MKITINDDRKSLDITIGRGRGDMYRPGGLICEVAPWGASGCPITLSICICTDGEILIREWRWTGGDANHYLHADEYAARGAEITDAMRATVAGLISGRILIDGIKIAVGATVAGLCKPDLEAEQALTGKRIYLA